MTSYQKEQIRKFIKNKKILPKDRDNFIFSYLSKRSINYPYICSFASKSNEINLWPINTFLAKNKKLILLKIDGINLIPYYVNDIEKDLTLNPSFKVLEPNPKYCNIAPLTDLSCVFVPSLAFDNNFHRLGYGKGYYDRFLKKLINSHTIGIGYNEQLLSQPLPSQPHDIFLKELLLF